MAMSAGPPRDLHRTFDHSPRFCARAIVDGVLRSVRPGSIVIAQCIGAPNAPATAAAISAIIPQLRRRGYRLVTLRRLLAVHPGPHHITAGP